MSKQKQDKTDRDTSGFVEDKPRMPAQLRKKLANIPIELGKDRGEKKVSNGRETKKEGVDYVPTHEVNIPNKKDYSEMLSGDGDIEIISRPADESLYAQEITYLDYSTEEEKEDDGIKEIQLLLFITKMRANVSRLLISGMN